MTAGPGGDGAPAPRTAKSELRTRAIFAPLVVAVLRIRKADFQADADYHRYCETQVDLVTRPGVLKAALQRPDIVELKCLRGQKDPLSWLTRIVKAQKPRFS